MKLQIPPELHNQSLANTNFVPLPKRSDPNSKHQIALIIREGRRVASSLTDFSKSSQSSRDDSRPPTTMTSLSTILEQDFTVEGKKGNLGCPFSQPKVEDDGEGRGHGAPPHDTSDPICVAMYDDLGSQHTASGAGAAKCPIRYMDHHSPEEIAHYLETHKHELPRSHEVCVRRYQRNEDDIRKLDAKYGNLANMVEGLSRIHQPMLPERDTRPQSDVERTSNQRVENWAQTVSATVTCDDPDRAAPLEPSRESDDGHDEDGDGDDPNHDGERRGRFDRPLKEVRVGESPSRPWGISVPIFDTPSGRGESGERPESPPPAPVPMPSSLPSPPSLPETPAKGMGKCPFDHTKLRQMMDNGIRTPRIKQEDDRDPDHDNHDDHDHDRRTSVGLGHNNGGDMPAASSHQPFAFAATPGDREQATRRPRHEGAATPPPQPAFLDAPDVARPKPGAPQMLFTGPVFIGYPVEQAIQIMQHLQGRQ